MAQDRFAGFSGQGGFGGGDEGFRGELHGFNQAIWIHGWWVRTRIR
jgi:hypothetical protein